MVIGSIYGKIYCLVYIVSSNNFLTAKGVKNAKTAGGRHLFRGVL